MTPTTLCPLCGKGELHPGERERTRTVGGITYAANLPASVCDACGEAIFTTPTVRAFNREVTAAVAASGARTGDTVTMLRKTAGLTGVALARLLGVTPETVSRWEHADRTPDRATMTLLGALAVEACDGVHNTRDRLEALARTAEDGAPPTRVTLQVRTAA